MRVTDLLERQAARTPDRIALVEGSTALTYAELHAEADRLAAFLSLRGVGPEVIVGLHLPYSAELMVALLGVMKAGGAYVPLEPRFPAEWLEHMAVDSGAALALAAEATALPVPEVIPFPKLGTTAPWSLSSPIEARGGPDDLIYLLYTSGSTGRPKGVEITHRSVVNFLESMRHELSFGAEVMLGLSGLTFDIAALEILLTWATGGRLVLSSDLAGEDPEVLRRELEDSGATVLQSTPSIWGPLVRTGWRPRPGFLALCGGEPMSEELFAELAAKKVHLFNLYGPTETTIWSTLREMTSAEGAPLVDRVTIGRPIANTTVHVLDDALAPVEEGELCIGGAGVARGYHHLPELTRARFVPDPFSPGGRLYRTGDRARFLDNGELALFGRLDHQIKIHGIRIEPGEIEAAIREVSGAGECVVVLGEGKRLIAYVVAAELDPGALASALARKLPAVMIPSAFLRLDRLPLTPNKKLDRRALPPL